MNSARQVVAATFLLLIATFPAVAQEQPAPAAPVSPEAPVVAGAQSIQAAPAPVQVQVASAPEKPLVPWRGSGLTYGHAATALTFAPGAEPDYNPTWAHRLELRPEWHLGPQLFFRGRFELAQELTLSDDTTYKNEVVWSDPSLDIGLAGIVDPWAGIRLAGNLRTTLGLSKGSANETRIVTLGPGLSLSRKFAVLEGITLRYDARYTQRFHRYTTRQNAGASIPAVCFDPRAVECSILTQSPVRNVQADLSHGATVAFSPHRRVSLAANFQMFRGWLYPLSQSEFDPIVANSRPDTTTRDLWGFNLSADVELVPELSVGLSSSTFNPQLSTDSTRRAPFFNRFTNLSLDLSVDLESLLSRI